MPIDCFFRTLIFGADEGIETSDLNTLKRITPQHKLSTVKVCTDYDDTNVVGI